VLGGEWGVRLLVLLGGDLAAREAAIDDLA